MIPFIICFLLIRYNLMSSQRPISIKTRWVFYPLNACNEIFRVNSTFFGIFIRIYLCWIVWCNKTHCVKLYMLFQTSLWRKIFLEKVSLQTLRKNLKCFEVQTLVFNISENALNEDVVDHFDIFTDLEFKIPNYLDFLNSSNHLKWNSNSGQNKILISSKLTRYISKKHQRLVH